MKASFSSITKSLTKSTVDGAALYAAIKGYKVANHMAGNVLPASFTGPIKNIAVAVGYSYLADMIAPVKYRNLFGTAAMSEAIAGFVDPFVDPMLLKSNLIGIGSLSTLSAYQVGMQSATPPTGPAPMLGYASMKGYASMRGMGRGLSSASFSGGEAMSGMQ